jgi:hypothetical protein
MTEAKIHTQIGICESSMRTQEMSEIGLKNVFYFFLKLNFIQHSTNNRTNA